MPFIPDPQPGINKSTPGFVPDQQEDPGFWSRFAKNLEEAPKKVFVDIPNAMSYGILGNTIGRVGQGVGNLAVGAAKDIGQAGAKVGTAAYRTVKPIVTEGRLATKAEVTEPLNVPFFGNIAPESAKKDLGGLMKAGLDIYAMGGGGVAAKGAKEAGAVAETTISILDRILGTGKVGAAIGAKFAGGYGAAGELQKGAPIKNVIETGAKDALIGGLGGLGLGAVLGAGMEMLPFTKEAIHGTARALSAKNSMAKLLTTSDPEISRAKALFEVFTKSPGEVQRMIDLPENKTLFEKLANDLGMAKSDVVSGAKQLVTEIKGFRNRAMDAYDKSTTSIATKYEGKTFPGITDNAIKDINGQLDTLGVEIKNAADPRRTMLDFSTDSKMMVGDRYQDQLSRMYRDISTIQNTDAVGLNRARMVIRKEYENLLSSTGTTQGGMANMMYDSLRTSISDAIPEIGRLNEAYTAAMDKFQSVNKFFGQKGLPSAQNVGSAIKKGETLFGKEGAFQDFAREQLGRYQKASQGKAVPAMQSAVEREKAAIEAQKGMEQIIRDAEVNVEKARNTPLMLNLLSNKKVLTYLGLGGVATYGGNILKNLLTPKNE